MYHIRQVYLLPVQESDHHPSRSPVPITQAVVSSPLPIGSSWLLAPAEVALDTAVVAAQDVEAGVESSPSSYSSYSPAWASAACESSPQGQGN